MNPLVVMEVGKLVTQSIKSFGEYMNTREIEKTERIRIAAVLTAVTEKINADRAVFEMYIANSFEERERLYQMADKVLNKAIENADTEMMKIALNCTINIYNKNPLDGFDLNSQDALSSGMKSFLK
ncbi:MAG: hypothetical protein UHX00_04955 [Caryophanon sp.]|nr:hypothetical protein [Caryophanon sp.]